MMKRFIKFILIWISQQLAIPFWMVGHIHLSMNMTVYDDVKILFASLGMNVLVAIGFWLDWKQHSANAKKEDGLNEAFKQINENRRLGVTNSSNIKRVVDEINARVNARQ